MDNPQGTQGGQQQPPPKKGSLESLSRDELIKKCRGLLGIAQKAKQARDEFAEENRKLREESSNYELQKEADKNALVAMKEIVESLTENKLTLANQIGDLQREKKVKINELVERNQKLDALINQNEAFKRQIARLEEENEDLLKNLESMEMKMEKVNEFGKQQKKDLVILEKQTEKWSNLEVIVVNLQQELNATVSENEELKKRINETNRQLAEKSEENDKLKVLWTETEHLKAKCLQFKEQLEITSSQAHQGSHDTNNLEHKLKGMETNLKYYEEKQKELENKLELSQEENQRLHSCCNQISGLQTRLSEIARQLAETDQEREKFQKDLENSLQQVARLQQENEELRLRQENPNDDQNNDLAKLQQDYQKVDSQMRQLNIQYNKAIEEGEKLRDENTKKVNEIQKLTYKIQEFTLKLGKIQESRLSLKRLVEQNRESFSKWPKELENTIRQVSHYVKVLLTENQNQKQHIEYLEHEQKLHENSSASSAVTLEGIKNLIELCEKSKNDFKLLDNENHSQKLHIEFLENELRTAEINRSNNSTELSESTINEHEKILEEFHAENIKLKENIKGLEKEVESKSLPVIDSGTLEKLIELCEKAKKDFELLNFANNELESRMLDEIQKNKTLTAENSKLQTELERVGDFLEGLVVKDKESSRKLEEMEQNRDEIDNASVQFKNDLLKAQEFCEEKLKQIESLKESHANSEKRCNVLEEERLSLEKEIQKLKQLPAKIGALKEENSVLTEINAQLKTENGKIQESFNEKLDEISKLTKTIENIQKSNEEHLTGFQTNLKNKENEIEKLTEIAEALTRENSEMLQQSQNNYDDNLNQLTETLEQKNNEISTLKETLKDFETKNQEISKSLEDLKMENIEIAKQNMSEHKKLSAENEEFVERCKKLGRIIEELEAAQGLWLLEKNDYSQNLSTMQENLDKILSENCSLSKKLEEITEKERSIHLETIAKLEQENMSLSQALEEKCELTKRLQSSLKVRETENSDLLAEMRELNEALKGRGDVISRQQDTIKELEGAIRKSNEQLSKIESNLCQKDAILSTKDSEIINMNQQILSAKNEVATLSQQAKESEKIIKTLSVEISTLRDRQFDAQSETVSTSTISRVEETARLREVDESFEEKYTKLRSLAIKLKKKVQEQATQILKLEGDNQKNFEEKNDINNKLGTISVQVKNLQALQNENDKLLDEIDKFKDEISTKDKEIKSLEAHIKDLSDENNKMKNLLTNDKKAKTTLDTAVKEYQNQIKTLKQEKDDLNRTLKDQDKEREKLRKDVEDRDRRLEKFQKDCDALRNEIEKLKATNKKSNVLNLEIDAYEKSLNDINQKFEAKRALVNELQESLESKKDKITSLENQIKLLDENLESEKIHSQELKHQIEIQQAKLKESDHEKLDLRNKFEDLAYETETLKSDRDKLTIQHSETSSEKEKFLIILQNEKEKLLHQTLNLEENLERTINKLKLCERELEDSRAEFASYKVRAQSILRQNQSKESSRERELEDELNTKQSIIEALNLRISAYIETIDVNERKLEEIREDNERIQRRCTELIQLLEESRLQNETFLDDNRKQSIEYHESLKSQRLQIETLKNAYKKQIEDLEKKHIEELHELRKKSANEIGANSSSRLTSRIAPFGGSSKSLLDEQKIDLILMEREAAEGSEANLPLNLPKRKISSTTAARSRRDLIPLDELLNSSTFDDNTNDENLIDNRPISPTIELQMTKEKLSVQESRARYLTAILAEAEQDLAKLTQLNEVLKEEVRRHERSIEREPHIHNSEYLKNVVLKFLTLTSGDERTRLVPVLNTILKLSPDETQTLQNVAKGVDLGGRSWGSFLPVWSNHQ